MESFCCSHLIQNLHLSAIQEEHGYKWTQVHSTYGCSISHRKNCCLVEDHLLWLLMDFWKEASATKKKKKYKPITCPLFLSSRICSFSWYFSCIIDFKNHSSIICFRNNLLKELHSRKQTYVQIFLYWMAYSNLYN